MKYVLRLYVHPDDDINDPACWISPKNLNPKVISWPAVSFAAILILLYAYTCPAEPLIEELESSIAFKNFEYLKLFEKFCKNVESKFITDSLIDDSSWALVREVVAELYFDVMLKKRYV